ncbi:MAG: hypothetical protein QXY48_04205 [Sulfolobales archaeon]
MLILTGFFSDRVPPLNSAATRYIDSTEVKSSTSFTISSIQVIVAVDGFMAITYTEFRSSHGRC